MIKAFLRRQTMQFIVTHSARTAHNTKLHLERCPAGGLGHALDGLHGAVQRDAGRGVRGGRGGGAEQQQQRQQQHGDTERAADTLTLGGDYYISTIQSMHLCIVLIKTYVTHFPYTYSHFLLLLKVFTVQSAFTA